MTTPSAIDDLTHDCGGCECHDTPQCFTCPWCDCSPPEEMTPEEELFASAPYCDNCGYSGADRKPDAYPGEDCPKCGGEVK